MCVEAGSYCCTGLPDEKNSKKVFRSSLKAIGHVMARSADQSGSFLGGYATDEGSNQREWECAWPQGPWHFSCTPIGERSNDYPLHWIQDRLPRTTDEKRRTVVSDNYHSRR